LKVERNIQHLPKLCRTLNLCSMSSEITAEKIEDVIGKPSESFRFANFCNAVVMAEGSASATTIPILSEKPGADGGMDGEWTIPADVSSDFKSPFGLPGWNVFQYKARSIAGDGRKRAFSNLCNDLKGALAKLIGRLPQPKECRQYSLSHGPLTATGYKHCLSVASATFIEPLSRLAAPRIFTARSARLVVHHAG
jgi:hypothetical protein